MRPKSEALEIGRRFAVRRTQHAFPIEPARDNFTLLSIVDGAGVLQARDETGALWTSTDLRTFVGPVRTKATLAWTLSLPESSDALDYVAAHLHPTQPWPRKTGARPFLFLVVSVDDGVATCIPLARAGRTNNFTRQWPDDIRISNDDFHAGNLVVSASLEEGLDETGPIFAASQHGVIARHAATGNVGRFLPTFEDDGIEYAVFAEYENTFLIARENGRADQCVVLFAQPEELTEPVVLAWSGTKIARLRHPRHPARWSIENTFHTKQKSAGIWLFSNVEFQMVFDLDGNPDFYWSGEFSPATAADLAKHDLVNLSDVVATN
jgi:hypothetical protein